MDILFESHRDSENNGLGKIILNRPNALNALNASMFSDIERQLMSWNHDPQVKAVLITSNSEKAFCAGGDIRAIYENRHLPVEQVAEYFQREYAINRIIYHYQKPFISFLNGITMGGGFGVSIHGSHPIGTEQLKLAMPETIIGFFPDVGASYHLSRLPHHIGFYLGLTGDSIGVHDAGVLGLVKYFVPSHQLNSLEQDLIHTPFSSADHQIVGSIIQKFSEPFGRSDLMSRAIDIEPIFSLPTVEAIVSALDNKNAWASSVKSQLLQRSPTSLKVTLKQFQRANQMTFDEVMDADLTIARHFLLAHDFFEGIRAAIIDKDRQPQWNPVTLSLVADSAVQLYFQ